MSCFQIDDTETPLSSVVWPYDLRNPLANTTNYLFLQSTDLETSILNTEKQIMFTNETDYAYMIYANTTKEAWDAYLRLRPQISVEVKKHSSKELDVIIGTYGTQTLRDVRFRLEIIRLYDA